jgi:hypothetical protein
MDRVSGSNKSPYGVQQKSIERPTEGRVRASRTHARQQSRVEQGVDFASVEKKWSNIEMEKVHKLVTSLAGPDADIYKVAGQFTKLSQNFKDKDISELFISKFRELKPETRAAIGSKLDRIEMELKSADAVKLVTTIRNAAVDLAKS